MARPKSDDKRDLILAAAVRVFAERGLAAPTSAITKAAGVAEGTLFTYFRTKDDLLNTLYREIKLHLAGVLMSDFARRKDVRSKLEHIWECYVNWGLRHPTHRQVLSMLAVSGVLTEETKAVGMAPFAEIQVMARDAAAQGVIRDIPLEFVAASMEKLAEATMEFIAHHPSQAAEFRKSGFEMLWNGIRKI